MSEPIPPGAPTDTNAPIDRSFDVPPGPSLTRGLVVGAAAIIVLAGLHAASSFVSLVVLSVLVSLLLAPLRLRLVGAGVGPAVAVLLCVGAYVAVLGVAGLLIGFGLAGFLRDLPAYRSELTTLIEDAIGSPGVADSVSAALSDAAVAFGGAAASMLSTVAYSVVVVAYLLVEAPNADRRVLSATGGRADALARARRTGDRLRSYVIARSVLGLAAAVANTVVLLLLGIPSAFLWGVVSFLTNYLPNVGFALALIPPAALGLVVGGPATAILVIVAYSVINVITDYAIQPHYIGSSVDLSAVVVTLSLVFWAVVLGPAGALFAIPLTVAAAALADSFSGSRPLARLLTQRAE